MHRLVHRNPSHLDVQDQYLRPLIDVTNDNDNEKSTYVDMNNEGNEPYDSDNEPTPIQNDTPVSTGVTEADLCNLWWNSGVHGDNVEEN